LAMIVPYPFFLTEWIKSSSESAYISRILRKMQSP
jgi:hypothetical protein